MGDVKSSPPDDLAKARNILKSSQDGSQLVGEKSHTVVNDSSGSGTATLQHETFAAHNGDIYTGGRNHDLSQISSTQRHGDQAAINDMALSINPATSSFVDSGYGSKSSASSKQRVESHEDDLDSRSIRTDGK